MITLVTGATGFIGSHLARLLVQRGCRVRALVRPASQLDALAGLSVDVVRGDLRDPASLANAVRGVWRVFHAAADYRLWTRDPRALYDTNVEGTRHLLDVCRRIDLDRFVYTSSVATLAVPRRDALSDENTTAPIDEIVGHYKRSKLLAERAVLVAASDGLPAIVVNPTTPVGPGDWKPTPTGRIIVDFLRGRMVAYVDTGLNLIPVEDVAAGHVLAAERGRVGERYILGGRNMSLKEIFDMLAVVSGRPAPQRRMPLGLALATGYVSELFARILHRDPRVPLEGVRMARHKMFVDVSKARRELGFESGSIEEALGRAVSWYLERGYAPPGPPQ
ncbi:MAG: NAD-dependent dehydratase [Acidobacteria bacterium]|nr:MAG: NAD-dependent dehydratase [Acidobacteriota bacterium]